MLKFGNLKILAKILVLLSLLSIVSLWASVFATGKMRYIDDTYAGIIDGPGAANLAVARANRNLVYIERSIYRLLGETTADGVRQTQNEISNTEGFFNNQLKTAVRRIPGQAARIRALGERYQAAMAGACKDTTRLAASLADADKKAATAEMHASCDPALYALMLDISALTNDIISISDKASDNALAVTNATIRETYILIIGGLAVVAGLAIYLTTSGISRPIRAIAFALEELVRGNYDTEIAGAGRKDEVGGFARAALVFRDQGREAVRLRAEQAAAREQAESDKRTALTNMAERIEQEAGAAVQQISERTTAMTQIAEKMRGLAGRTGNAATGAASATAVALANAQTVASAAEELAASIGGIRGQVNDSTAVVDKAVEASNATRTAIEALNQRVGQIGTMAKMIGDIAAKTNLLALNATIEAARAGDAGKGFAVVANEVKLLATQTAQSTLEINQHVNEVGTATAAATATVARIESAITEVNDIVRTIAAAMEQQGTATSEIAHNVTETASAVNEMNSRNDEVAGEAEEAGRYAAEVLANTTKLDSAIRDLRRTMIGIVRTSTTEVDRRIFQRFDIAASCNVELPGKASQPAQIVNMSEGGARLQKLPDLAPGTSGKIRLAGIPAPMNFKVVGAEDGLIRIAFTSDETAQARRTWIETRRSQGIEDNRRPQAAA